MPGAPQGWSYNAYSYNDPAHVHAVTGLSNGDTFTYDANGNMTQRVENGVTYEQEFDIENRLSSVTVNGQTYQYVFDGDGNKIKEIRPDGSYTVYIGDLYDVSFDAGEVQTGATVTYYAGTQRIASRTDGTLSYLLTDHLGSSSVTLNTLAAIVAEERYYPFGELRDDSWSLDTNFGYTGQRRLEGTGLLDYNARMYLPSIGRFISPDPIIQDKANPQAFNRYSYVSNNPIRYIDPTGLSWIDGLEQFVQGVAYQWARSNYDALGVPQNVTPVDQWAAGNDDTAFLAGRIVGGLAAMAQGIGEVAAGFTVGGGGSAASCGTVVLCIAGSGASIMTGAALVAHGAAITLSSAVAVGQQTVALMAKVDQGPPKGGVYTLREKGIVVYTGRSKNLEQRRDQHGRTDKGQFDFEVEFRTDNYDEQRGLEQLLYDKYQPPLNRIKPISPSNPNRDTYIKKAQQIWNKLTGKRIAE